MVMLNNGQCGLCKHFGEHEPGADRQQLVQIRTAKQAREDEMHECGHPQHEPLHLVVTAVSGCNGFEPADTSS